MNNKIIKFLMFSIITTSIISLTGFYESSAQTDNNLSNTTKVNEMETFCQTTVNTAQGPYYIENSQVKEGKEFSQGVEGQRLIVSGQVLDFRDCSPVYGAILDFWQTDANGEYDNEGFILRGKVISDENGNYTLDTIMPGRYSEGDIKRPAHIHVKTWIPDNPGNPSLVTQLYFKDDPFFDELVKDPLIMDTVEKNGTIFANFDFVLENYK